MTNVIQFPIYTPPDPQETHACDIPEAIVTHLKPVNDRRRFYDLSIKFYDLSIIAGVCDE